MNSQQTLINNLELALNLAKSINTDKHPEKKDIDTCYYCLDKIDINKNFSVLNCGHKSHLKCLLTDLALNSNVKCGLCRNDVMSPEEKAEIRRIKAEGARAQQQRQEEYMRELMEEQRQEQRQEELREFGLTAEDRENNERVLREAYTADRQRREQERRERYQQREAERNEETAQYSQKYRHLLNNRRVNLLDSWRLRINTCGYEILQTLLDADNNKLHWKETTKIMGRIKNSYTHDTIRRNVMKLKTKGYITLSYEGRYLTEIQLTEDFKNIN